LHKRCGVEVSLVMKSELEGSLSFTAIPILQEPAKFK